MSATQLGFNLRTSTNVKTVHLLGSWDNYARQLPLSKDAAKAGAWKGTFRFQGATIKPGQRYWYYYIMDGYHVSHDPAKPSTKEPTTGRTLNILDVASNGKVATAAATAPAVARPVPAPINTSGIVTGRPLSPSLIAHPKPSKPYASRGIREADYSMSPTMEDVVSSLEATSLYDGKNYPVSPVSSVSSASDSDFSAPGSPASSVSSFSDISTGSACRCNRFGVTRDGKKVLLDCGGDRCGYSSSEDEDSSVCDSDEEIETDSDEEVPVAKVPTKSAKKPVATATTRRTTAIRR